MAADGGLEDGLVEPRPEAAAVETFAPVVHEQRGLRARHAGHAVADFQISRQRFARGLAHGHDALFAALAEHAHQASLKIDVANVEAHALAGAQARGVNELEERASVQAAGRVVPGSFEHGGDFLRAEELGQALRDLGGAQAQRRITRAAAGALGPAVEGAQRGELAGERGSHAAARERREEAAQLLVVEAVEGQAILVEPGEELAQIVAVGTRGLGRQPALLVEVGEELEQRLGVGDLHSAIVRERERRSNSSAELV